MEKFESDHDYFRWNRTIKWIFLFLDTFAFFTALSTFGVCLWIRFDLDFKEWVREMKWYSYWNCMYVIMIAMVIVVVITLLHIYGIMRERLTALLWTQIVHVVCIVMEFIGCVCICVYGVEESKVLIQDLKEVFFDLIYRSDYDPRAMRILRIVQEYVGCCGANGSEDYNAAFKPMPMECRDPVNGREYLYGCAQQMAWWLEPWTATLAAVCIALILIHIAQIILTRGFRARVKEYRDYANYEYDYDY